ncbi:MAG: cell division protein FtsQ/DivIB [Christensenellaceae bacterium]
MDGKQKKNLALGISVGFLIVCVVFLIWVMITRVTEFRLVASVRSDEAYSEVLALQKTLDERIGTNYVSVDEEEIAELAASPYLEVVSVKKAFPDLVVVTVREKWELFAVQDGEDYYMLDKNGVILARSSVNANRVDGGENVLLSGVQIVSPVVGETAQLYLSGGSSASSEGVRRMIALAGLLDEKLGGLRSCVESVSLRAATDNPQDEIVTFVTKEGVLLCIADPSSLGEEKAAAVTEKYLALSDVNKLFGRVEAGSLALSETEIYCVYSAR